MIECPARNSGSSSSSGLRICEMSISMWLNPGVPSVSTMWSAAAAAWSRSDSSTRPDPTTRSSSSCVPVSWNGMRRSVIARSTEGSLSIPTTWSPRSANVSASGRPTRPSPTMATLVATGETLGASSANLLLHELAREGRQERRVVVEVPGQQPTRLLGDPVRPLEPAVLHPGGGLRDAPCVEVEGGADGGHHRHVKAGAHPGHPLLLARHAGPDPQHVGPVGVDALDELGLLVRLEVAERGRVAADDPDAGVVAAQVEGELGEGALVAAAVEPHAVALLGAAARVAAHQLRAVHAVRQVLAEQVRGPDERHPVRDGQRGAEQRGLHLVVVMGH